MTFELTFELTVSWQNSETFHRDNWNSYGENHVADHDFHSETCDCVFLVPTMVEQAKKWIVFDGKTQYDLIWISGAS